MMKLSKNAFFKRGYDFDRVRRDMERLKELWETLEGGKWRLHDVLIFLNLKITKERKYIKTTA